MCATNPLPTRGRDVWIGFVISTTSATTPEMRGCCRGGGAGGGIARSTVLAHAFGAHLVPRVRNQSLADPRTERVDRLRHLHGVCHHAGNARLLSRGRRRRRGIAAPMWLLNLRDEEFGGTRSASESQATVSTTCGEIVFRSCGG